MAGVCFKITDGGGTPLGSGDGTFYTNSAGEIVIEGVEPGTTVVARELSCPEGFVMSGETKSVKGKAGEKGPELIFWNEKSGSLVITKKNSLDGSPLAGVQFLLTYADGSYVDADNGHMSSKGLYETDQNGEIRISGIVGTVIAKEIKTLPNFTIDPATQSQTVQINPDDCQYLTFYNTPVGNFELIKVVEGNESQRIPNVTFEIRRADDDALVDTITTNSDGRATLQLAAGNYYAVEKECPKEFKLDSSKHSFTMKDGKNTTLTVKNKAFSGILIHKTDSITGEGIYGVSFLLYDSKNTPIGQYTSDNSGYVYIEGLTDGGRYYLRELENKGYVADTQMKTVYAKAGETTLIEWKNTPITGQIQIWKKSADDNPINGFPAGTALEGAVFEIYDKANNLVDTIKSDSKGLAVSKPLPLSRYTIKEVTAPAYYSVTSDIPTVYLEHEGQIVQIEVLDKSVYTNVSVSKSGYTQVVPGQSIRYTFKDIGNNSTVPLDSFYWRDTLPTDAVRLDKIITGTWSAKLTYKAVYKTNLSNGEYRTLADNLSTEKNYTLDASAAALGLASDEYVTEVTFMFGRVPAGFKQMQTPYIYCNVVSWLTHEYRFANKTDVGGIWQGQWVMANDRWVSIVYRGGPKPTLPKTGY